MLLQKLNTRYILTAIKYVLFERIPRYHSLNLYINTSFGGRICFVALFEISYTIKLIISYISYTAVFSNTYWSTFPILYMYIAINQINQYNT